MPPPLWTHHCPPCLWRYNGIADILMGHGHDNRTVINAYPPLAMHISRMKASNLWLCRLPPDRMARGANMMKFKWELLYNHQRQCILAASLNENSCIMTKDNGLAMNTWWKILYNHYETKGVAACEPSAMGNKGILRLDVVWTTRVVVFLRMYGMEAWKFTYRKHGDSIRHGRTLEGKVNQILHMFVFSTIRIWW